MKKELTIVVLSYNHSNYIVDCLINCLKISNYFEILIIDDGSIDDSIKVIQDFIVLNPKRRISLYTKANKGLVDSLNLAITLCKTKFVYFVASDDIPQHLGINNLLKTIQCSSTPINLAIGGAKNLFENSEISPTYSKKTIDFISTILLQTEKEFESNLFLNYPHPILIQSTIFSLKLLNDVKGWDKKLISDDYQIFVKIFIHLKIKNEKIIFENEQTTVLYRHHANNSYKKLYRQFVSINQIISQFSVINWIQRRALLKNKIYFTLKSLSKMKILDSFKILFTISR